MALLSTPAPRHRRNSRTLLAVVLIATLTLIAGCAGQGAGTANPGYVSSDGAVKTWEPDQRTKTVTVKGTTFEGESIDTEQMLGSVVVINTWYASCPPCRVEAPDLARIANESAADGVQFFGINGTDEAGAAQAFQRTFDIPYGSIEDRKGSAVAALQGVVPLQAVPTTVVLDRQGRVAATMLGVVTPSTLETVIAGLLAEEL